MNVDSMYYGRENEPQRRRVLTTVVRRYKLLENRYPSESQSLLSIFDQAVVSGTSFLTAAVIGSLTSPELLGLYYLVLSIVIIVSGIHEQVIAAPYWVYSKRLSGDDLSLYSGSFWVHHFILTVVIAVCILTAIIVSPATGRTEVGHVLWTLLGTGPLILLRDGIRRFSLANLQIKYAIVLDVIVALAQLGGLLALGVAGWLSIGSVYGVMAGACLLACVTWYVLDPPPRVQFNRARILPDWRSNWGFGRWALRSFLVGSTTPFVMLWILALTIGQAAAGVLGACATVIGLTNIILLGVCNVLTAQAAEAYVTGGSSELRCVLQRTAAFFVTVVGGFCLLVLVTGDWLVVVFFGRNFQGTGAILFALALSALMNSLGMVVGNGLWAIDNPRANFVADVVCMIVTLAAAAAIVVPLGAFGAALASLVGMTAGVIVRSVTFARCLAGQSLETTVAANSAISS